VVYEKRVSLLAETEHYQGYRQCNNEDAALYKAPEDIF
jgi:hypothetical protein